MTNTNNDTYIRFTEEMKRDYTILVPDMLPMHFRLIMKILSNYGYKMEMLESRGREIAETGLKYVHNDTCYPAILVIGQFLHALKSGKYNTHKVALMLFQTGGGCRASNYISLLRKALEKAGFGYVPVVPMSLVAIEKHPGWHLSLPMLHKVFYGVFYGDILMSLVNQVKPYEIEQGAADRLCTEWIDALTVELGKRGFVHYKTVLKRYGAIVKSFADIPREKRTPLKVGVVGEIYVKFSSLGNNELCRYLIEEGAEPVLPGLLDFLFYCIYNQIEDHKLYGRGALRAFLSDLALRFLERKQADVIRTIRENSGFVPPSPIRHTIALTEGYIGRGTKMGEGWLLTAEMLELYDIGVKNIICTQPFGCLPNHICGKGMIRPIKEKKPDINIVAIDYDAGASGVNQLNRIKLMLSNAREEMRENEGVQAKEHQNV